MLASIAAFLACALFGVVRSERLKEHERLLYTLYGDIAAIGASMRFKRAPVCELFEGERLKNKELFCELNERMAMGDSLECAYSHIASKNAPPLCRLNVNELYILDEFFSVFGKSDMESETRLIEHTVSLLREAHEIARETARKKARLTTTCGLLVGLCAFIIFL